MKIFFRTFLVFIIVIGKANSSHGQITYTFIGNGSWRDSANWINRLVPPTILDSGSQIMISPLGVGVCVLDTLQFISTGALLTMGQNKKFTVSGDLYLTDPLDGKYPSEKIKVSFGSSVPNAAKQQTDSIYSATGIIKPGVDSLIDIIKYKDEGLVFAVNKQNEFMFISIVDKNDTIINLDANNSAIAMVRFTLNPIGTGEQNSMELNTAIQASPSFNQLLNALQQQLINGNSIFSNDSAILKAEVVANEIIGSNGGLISGRPLDNQRYYFIDGLFKGENLWFEDDPGSDVKLFNDTRLYWQVTSRDEHGTIIDQKELDWEPFKWQEIIASLNPPTETLVNVVNTANNSGEFTLTIEQDVNTRSKHCLFMIQNCILTILDWFGRPGAVYEKELECSGEIAKTLLNEQMPLLLTQPSGTAALQYMSANLESIDAPWYYEKLSKCGIVLPNLSDFTSNLARKKFLSSLVSFWNKIQFAISAGTSLGFALQLTNYWNYNTTQSFCKNNGSISNTCMLLTTTAVSNITETSAGSGGNITSDGGSPIIARGVCWNTTSNPTIADNRTNDGSNVGIFTSNVSGLSASTFYYLRAYAINNTDTAYGNELTFNTLQTTGQPILTTSVEYISQRHATAYGLVTNATQDQILSFGVCWSTTPGPTITNSNFQVEGFPNFIFEITGLSAATQYYVRSYAIDATQDTVYSNEVNFKTLNLNTLDSTNWIGYFSVPCDPNDTSRAAGTPPRTNFYVSLSIIFYGDSTLHGTVTYADGPFHQVGLAAPGWDGTSDGDYTSITWTLEEFEVPAVFTISGTTMQGTFILDKTYGNLVAGCEYPYFFTKQ